jgi:hypothetical protein
MEKMNITSAQYIVFDGDITAIKFLLDGMTVSCPLDPANRHYAEIMRQVEVGELVIQDADAES